MHARSFYLLLCLWAFVILAGCAEDHTLSFKDVSYVKEFPQHSVILESKKVPLDLPGVRDIKLKDSILFLSLQGKSRAVKMYSYPALSYLGEFAQIGNGPGELGSAPFFSKTSFSCRGDSLFISIPDFKMKIVRYNVTAALSGDGGLFTQHPLDLDESALGVFSLDDSTSFYMSLSPDMTSLSRHLVVEGSELSLDAQEELSRAKIELQDGYAFNLLSAMPCFDSKSGIIVECCLAANRFNMYSIKDPYFKKTVVIGSRQSSIKKAESQMRLAPVLPSFFSHVDSYDDCFTILYEQPNSKKQSILIFDWKGNPIDQIDLPFEVTSVEIDFEHRILITLNRDTEEMYFLSF